MVKEGIHINAIYQHFKGNFYKVIDVANDCSEEENGLYVIYHACDENGIYKSIRHYYEGIEQEIVHQPFCRQYNDFTANVQGGYPYNPAIPRFKFIKQL